MYEHYLLPQSRLPCLPATSKLLSTYSSVTSPEQPRLAEFHFLNLFQRLYQESNTGTHPLTRFFGSGRNRIKGKRRYRRSILEY